MENSSTDFCVSFPQSQWQPNSSWQCVEEHSYLSGSVCPSSLLAFHQSNSQVFTSSSIILISSGNAAWSFFQRFLKYILHPSIAYRPSPAWVETSSAGYKMEPVPMKVSAIVDIPSKYIFWWWRVWFLLQPSKQVLKLGPRHKGQDSQHFCL